jgi:hypothetical protein
MFCNTCVSIVYFSRRLFCRFDLALSANSTSWRIASEREGLSGCCFAQVSIADLSVGESRIADTGSLPVAGRPRFLLGTTFFVDMLSHFLVVPKKRAEGKRELPARL